MDTNFLALAANLTDEALRAKVKVLAQCSREVTVELIAHLAELAARKLYCSEGPGSLFRYCTEILRFSEAAACNRIKAARAVRRFPVILELLADGRVNLTTIRLLSPHLTPENHHALLAEATGLTRRQVDKLVARLAPQPDVAPSICKLPAPKAAIPVAPAPVVPNDDLRKTAISPSEEYPPGPIAAILAPATHRPAIAPLAPERYRVQFTIDQETEEQLRRLQDLLRREIPDGDPGAIFVRALPLLFLEFHHANEPYALGGEATAENMALRCRAHNVYEAALIFGPYDPARVREAPAGIRELKQLLVPGPVGRETREGRS